MEMDTTLTKIKTSFSDVYMYIHHPTIPLKLKHLMKLRHILHQENHHRISHRVIYHPLRVSTQSTIIPWDRSLNITLNNTIYTLTPRNTETTLTYHTIHLFLNSYQGSPDLQHTYNGRYHNQNKISPQRLTLTTTLSSTQSTSRKPQRQYTIHTMTDTHDLGRTITFPAYSIHHQLSILILTTSMILSLPIFDIKILKWNILRYISTHRHQTHLILTAIILRRYHKIWSTPIQLSPNNNYGPTNSTTYPTSSVLTIGQYTD